MSRPTAIERAIAMTFRERPAEFTREVSLGGYSDDCHTIAATGPNVVCEADHEYRPKAVILHIGEVSESRIGFANPNRRIGGWRGVPRPRGTSDQVEIVATCTCQDRGWSTTIAIRNHSSIPISVEIVDIPEEPR